MKLSAINFKKQAVYLLPMSLRTLPIIELVKTFMPAFGDLQTRFFTNRSNNLYQLNHNGQVCYLRKVLNDAFPARDKTFLIEDHDPFGDWVYVYDEENSSRQLMVTDQPETFIYSVEVIGDYANFLVKIPQNLRSDDNLNQIKSLVNNYKLLSKKAIYEYY